MKIRCVIISIYLKIINDKIIMKKLLLIFFCLPMIGFGQEEDVDISKVTINERNFIYKYQNTTTKFISTFLTHDNGFQNREKKMCS